MIRLPFVRLFALVALLAIAPVVSAQAPAPTPAVAPTISGPPGTYFSAINLTAPGPVTLTGTWSGPAGLYSVTLPAGSTITQTATGITIVFAPATPAVPAPAPAAAPAHVLFPR